MLNRVVLILALAATVGMASAQDFFHRPSPLAGRTFLTLALFEEVRTELKTTPDTNTKLDAVLEKMQSGLQEAVSAGGQDPDAIRAAVDKMNKKYDDETLKLLSDDQTKRLKELYVQYNGATILADPDMSKPFKLTDDQKAQVKKIEDARWAKMREAFGGGGDDPTATINKIQEERVASLLKVLTDDQKKQLKDMEGAKFTFKKVEAGGGF